MTDTSKVTHFLMVSEGIQNWDPSLAWVMTSALVTFFCANRIFCYFKNKPLLSESWKHIPKRSWRITPAEMFGNILFGIGWGLIGLCPGPALALIVTLKSEAFVFVGSMIGGFLMYGYVNRKKAT